MSKTKRVKYKRWVSPVGLAKFAYIEKPREGYTEGDDPSYQIRVLLEDTKENRAWVDKVTETAEKEAKENKVKLKKVYHNPFIMPEDVDEDDFIPEEEGGYPKFDEDHRGKIMFNTRSKFQPARIDTERNSLSDDIRIFGDDTVRVKVEAAPYVSGANTGITLRLVTVQLVEKSAAFAGGGQPDTDGFDDIDGYVSNDDEEDF